MYHYVREVANSPYPGIKGLELKDFIGQIEYLQKRYNPITIEQLLEALQNQTKLPPNAVLLTFDDGYADNYRFVLPVLADKKLQGSFYPPAQAILEHKVLDVNKIHFILATAPGIPQLLKDISAQLHVYRKEFNLPSFDELFRTLAIASEIDTKEVIFIKRLLQVALPIVAREHITRFLFEKYVQKTEAEFSRELYMNIGQIRELQAAGMHIGSHAYSHQWLATLPENQQRTEVDLSLEFLKLAGADINNWTMTYPFGSYNASLLNILEEKKCRLAFKSVPAGIADIASHHKFEFPRIDTINIPVRA